MINHRLIATAAICCVALATQALAQNTDLTLSPPVAAPPADLPSPDIAQGSELMLYQDMPVVVAAGKREQAQQQVAASVTVVDANQIELFNYRSLADVLRDQRSFFIETNGLNAMAGVRGFLRPGEWNARILTLVDGRPTREMIFGQTHLDQDFVVPMEAVKRVEIVRGPGSALYGTNAVFGVVNVVTKDGADVNGVQAKLEGGTLASIRGATLFGKKFDSGLDVIGAVTASSTQGNNDIIYSGIHDAAHNYGHIKNDDGEAVSSGFLKTRMGDFAAQVDFETRQRGNRSATYLASWFDPGTMHEDRANLTLKLDHELAQGQSIHAMLFYGHYSYAQTYGYFDDNNNPYRYVSEANDDWVGEEIHYDWQVSKSLHLLLGADGSQALFTHQRDHDSIHGQVLNVDASTNSWGIFGESELKITDWLSLIAGARMDFVQSVGTNVSPRFAAILQPTKQDTLKAMYGRAFRAPNLYEMFYASPGYNVPNPALKPEICDTYEVVWERLDKSGWRSSLGGYVWKMTDAMDDYVLNDGALQTRNMGNIWANGVEAEIQRQWNDGTSVRFYGTYSQAEHARQRLTHSPQWIAGAALIFPIVGKNTFISLDPQFVGPMKSDLGQETHPSFVTNIVFTSRDIVKGWTFQAGVYNLFANYVKFPRDGAFNQVQPMLNYPDTRFLVSLSYRF